MATVEKPAGSGGTYTYTLTQAPAAAPSRTIFSDAARTVVAAAAAVMTATANPAAFTGTYPLTLAAGRYYLRHIYTTVGGATLTDDDDELSLVNPTGSVGGTVVALADVKAALNKTTTADDPELTRFLTAAEREYREVVGPMTGSRTERVTADGRGVAFTRYRTVSALTALTDANGVALALPAYEEADEGRIEGLPANSTVTVAYVHGVPANHREVIIADVAGYFAATQRATPGPGLPSEGYAATYGDRSAPIVLFPRIRALALGGVA